MDDEVTYYEKLRNKTEDGNSPFISLIWYYALIFE